MEAASVRLHDYGPHTGGKDADAAAAGRRAAMVKVFTPQGEREGFGFLAAWQRQLLIVTSRQVLPSPEAAQGAEAVFCFRDGQAPVEVPLEPGWLFASDEALGYAAVAFREELPLGLAEAAVQLAECRTPDPGEVVEVWRLAGGGRSLTRCFQVVERVGDGQMAYLTDVDPGCVGTPVFQQDPLSGRFLFAALHCVWISAARANVGLLADALLPSMAMRLPLAAMDGGRGSAAAQAQAVARLRARLEADERCKAQLAYAGGPARVAASLQAHPASPALLGDGFRVLATLGVHSAATAQEIARAGMIPWVCTAISAHPGVLEVQEGGCALVRSLAVHPEQRPALAAAHAPAVLVGAMESCLRSEALQVEALAALRLLFAHFPAPALDAPGGGSLAILRTVLLEHGASEEVLREGCALLERLAQSPIQRAAALAAAGAESVCTALAAFPGNAALQAYGCAALAGFAELDAAHVAWLGGVGLIEAALVRHPGSAAVQSAGAAALGCLASGTA